MKSELEKFRTRWLRWLGQKTREDKDTWVELLDCNWSGWALKVLEKHGFDLVPLSVYSNRMPVKYRYELAIHEADMEDLQELNHLNLTDLLERPRKKPKRKGVIK